VLRAEEHTTAHWTYAGAIALALGVTSSTLFYSGLSTLIPAWWIAHRVAPAPSRFTWPSGVPLRNALLVTAVTVLMLSTRFFTYPQGLAATARLLGDWLTQFSLSGELQALIAPVLAIGRYETAVVLLGIPALIWAIWRNHPLGTFLTYWILTAFALILVQRGVMDNALVAILPACLLAGLFSGQILVRRPTTWTWVVTASMVLVVGIVVVNLARYLRVAQTGDDLSNLWFGVLALASGAIALYYFWSMTNAAVGQGVLMAVLIVLGIYQWGTAWYLTHQAANDPRERWVQQGTDDDLPVMLDTLQEISNRVTNADADIHLYSAIDSPLLRWYLRDFWRAEFGATLPPRAQFEAILTWADVPDPALGTDYLGGDFGLLRSGATDLVPSAVPWTNSLRSWMFHESSLEILERRVVLWLRSDLVREQP